jgi:hypothetical protein
MKGSTRGDGQIVAEKGIRRMSASALGKVLLTMAEA